MKSSFSNIGWNPKQDATVYRLMKKYGFSGLEIAPTRIFAENPYDRLPEARKWISRLQADYGLSVPSMQSIWYGRQERLFGSKKEREALIRYTKKAVDLAEALGCRNLVFGCPKNRKLPENGTPNTAVPFFKILGDYAAAKGTVIGIEANPPIYGTDYINDTRSALELVRQVDSKGFMLNLDTGTMIQNKETISSLAGNVHLISHIHISEPGLDPIRERQIHHTLRELLEDEGYTGYISIEMRKTDSMHVIENVLRYVGSIFR